MIQKIKMLIKKAWNFAKRIVGAVAQRIRNSEKLRLFAKKLCSGCKKLWEKLQQFGKALWTSSENRLLLILIGAVLVLLILSVVFLFGIEWTKTVGICYQNDTNASNAHYRQLLEHTLSQKGFEVIITDADGDQSKQLEQIRELSKRHCKVLIVEPVMASTGQELMEALEESGIPAVLAGRTLENADAIGNQKVFCLEADAAMAGAVQAQMVMALPNGGDINGDGMVSFIRLQDGADEAWMAQQFQAYLTEQKVQSSQLFSVEEKPWTKCADALAAYGKDIEVILCAGDSMTAEAAQVIESFGLKVGQDVYLFGTGTSGALLQLVAQEKVSGTVDTADAERVGAVVDGIAALLGTQLAEPAYQVQFTAVTAENVSQLMPAEE